MQDRDDLERSMENRGPADRAREEQKRNEDEAQRADEADERRTREGEDVVDEASEESFPASDPPGYTGGHS